MIKIQIRKNKFYVDESLIQNLNSKGFGNNIPITSTKIKNKIFEINPIEILFLFDKKKIIFDEELNINFEKLLKITKIDLSKYIVYKDLKTRGYNVKTGLKYGFDFRVYDKGIKIGEDHSLWLVDVIEEKDKLKIKDLTGKNRIAHSANKKMLFAIVDFENSVTYLENSWKRL